MFSSVQIVRVCLKFILKLLNRVVRKWIVVCFAKFKIKLFLIVIVNLIEIKLVFLYHWEKGIVSVVNDGVCYNFLM